MIYSRLLASAAALALGSAALPAIAFAQETVAFTAPARDFAGQVSFASAEAGRPILPGATVVATGRGFQPGQSVRLYRAGQALTGEAAVNAEGGFEARFTLPADATPGLHPLVAVSASPYAAVVSELKISPDIAPFGAAAYSVTQAEVTRGLYQTAYSDRNDALFVTSAVGRPPVLQSELLRLDPETLAIEARVTPGEAPDRTNAAGETSEGGLYAVYGVGVDDVNDLVWVTQSRQNTVAVYRQADLSLVRQFDPGTVNHARDVVVDEQRGKVFASATFEPLIVVFDAASQEETARIEIASTVRGETFSAASLSLNTQAGLLYVVSNSTNEVAVVDTATNAVRSVFRVPNTRSAIGVSHDPQTGRIYVAAQGTDNVVILDGATGAVIADTPVGAGALNVVFDTASRHAFVSNRGSGTISVIDADGQLTASLDGAPQANHVATDGQGVIYAVTKGGADQDGANTVWRITPAR